MKEIPLTRGKVAIVDDADYELVSRLTWYFDGQYASARGSRKIGRKHLRMHRLILGVQKGIQIDHKDLNKLNNTRENLRICTYSENARNRKVQANNSIGIKGVWFDKRRNTFNSQIMVLGKKFNLGSYPSEDDAWYAYIDAASKHHGEFARCF